MSAPDGAPASTLERWIASGGHWRIIGERGEQVTVALLTCDGGEEMDRLVLDRAELP